MKRPRRKLPPDSGQPFAMLIFGVLIGSVVTTGIYELCEALKEKEERHNGR